MNETRNLKKGNGQKPGKEIEDEMEEVEGYMMCVSHKQKCLSDCMFINNPIISTID